MRQLRNPAKDRLEKGELAIGVGVRGLRGVEVARLMDHERVRAASDTVLGACKKHGKIPALGGIYGKDLLTRYLGLGFRMVLAGNDISLLLTAAQEQAKFVRGLGAVPR